MVLLLLLSVILVWLFEMKETLKVLKVTINFFFKVQTQILDYAQSFVHVPISIW